MDSKLKVIVQMPNNPGDVIMAMQAIQSSWLPNIEADEIEIHYIVDEECASLVEGSSLFSRIFIQPRSFIANTWSQSSLNDSAIPICENILSNFIQEIQTTQYDLAVNLYQGKSGPIIQALLKSDLKRGPRFSEESNVLVEDDWSAYLHSIPANRQANTFHTVDLYRRILRPALFEQTQLPPQGPSLLKLPPYPSFEWNNEFIVIQMGSAWPGKKWNENTWAKLVGFLLADFTFDIILIGAPQEKLESQALANINPRIHNLCGSTSLIGVAGILEKAQLLICPDTFAMHLAAAIQCPIFALFGPSNPVETGPWAENCFVANSLKAKEENFDFLGLETMKKIYPVEVFPVISQLLKNINPSEFELLKSPRSTILKGQWNANTSKIEFSDQLNSKVVPLVDSQPIHSVKPIQTNLTTPDMKELSSEIHNMLNNQLKLLNHMVSTGQWKENFNQLESEEGKIAALTHSNISMEKYRIHLNTISLRNGIQPYFQSRKRLVEKYISIY